MIGFALNRPRGRFDDPTEHTGAANGAEAIIHVCHAHCDCKEDWRPFVHLRPWEHPPKRMIDDWIQRFLWFEGEKQGEIPLALTLKLKRLLWTFRATYPSDPYKSKKLFFQSRVDARRRRLQLRSWINGIPRPHLYAKAYECFDWKDGKPRVNLDYVFVTREYPREKKIPAYTLHVSWKVVMEHTGCSRATAFRKINEGWTLADCVCACCSTSP